MLAVNLKLISFVCNWSGLDSGGFERTGQPQLKGWLQVGTKVETKTFLMKDERKMPRAKHERLLGFQRFVSIIRLEKVEFVISSPLIQFLAPLNNLSRSSKHFAKPLNVYFYSSQRIVFMFSCNVTTPSINHVVHSKALLSVKLTSFKHSAPKSINLFECSFRYNSFPSLQKRNPRFPYFAFPLPQHIQSLTAD